ncbi:MAG: hypothetical protein AMJ56_18025, partial [Anaerolineae bacterium SG8_19]
VGFVTAILASLILFPLAFMSVFRGEFYFLGNGTWQSAAYALWDSIFAVGMCLAAITFFRRYFNGDSKFGRFLSQQSYAVYLIHVPIIIFLAYALRGIDIDLLCRRLGNSQNTWRVEGHLNKIIMRGKSKISLIF